MSQPNQKQPQPKKELEPEVIKAIVDQQTQKLQLEHQRLRLEEKRLDQNARLAEKAMEQQAAFLKEQPKEHRKTLTRIAYIVGGIIAMFLLFMGFLVYTGNKDFASDFLKVCSYIATSALSFWVGRKSKPQSQSNNTPTDPADIHDAEVVDD
jgi:hypothetical protein